MARGSSVIDVLIVGDAKKLIGAFNDADKATGGLLKSAGKVFLGAGAIAKGFDLVQESLSKADTFNDAFDNLAGSIGKVDAQKIKDIAFDFTKIGLSADEVGTLANNFASFATAAGISAPQISAMLPTLLDVAAAVHAKTGKTLDEVVTDIGKAAAGNQKPVSEYGVVVDKALNPNDRLSSILDQLKTKFGDAGTATSDFAGAQETLGAKWDNLMIKIGDGLDGPLKGVLGFINDEIDAIPGAIDGWNMLGKAIEDFGRFALTPIATVNDALGALGNTLSGIVSAFEGALNSIFGSTNQSDASLELRRRQFQERNGQGSP